MKARWWSVWMATCTVAAGAMSLGVVIFGLNDRNWLAMLIFLVVAALTIYALVVSSAFTRIDPMTNYNKVIVFSIGTVAIAVSSIPLLAIAVVLVILWALLSAVGQPSQGPLEVKLARNFWTDKLK